MEEGEVGLEHPYSVRMLQSSSNHVIRENIVN